MQFGEDIDLWGQIALGIPIVFSWEGKPVYHRDAQTRLSRRGSRSEFPDECELVKEVRTGKNFDVTSAFDRKYVEKYVAMLEIQRSVRMIMQGHSRGVREVLRSCATNHYNGEGLLRHLAPFIPYGSILALRRCRASLDRGWKRG